MGTAQLIEAHTQQLSEQPYLHQKLVPLGKAFFRLGSHEPMRQCQIWASGERHQTPEIQPRP